MPGYSQLVGRGHRLSEGQSLGEDWGPALLEVGAVLVPECAV